MIGIYKITNKINGKIYIGQSRNICARWNQHYLESYNDNIKDGCVLLHKAIRKYGIENFIFEIETLCDEENLADEEIYFIRYYNSCVLDGENNGYNITRGGDGFNRYFGEQAAASKLTNNDVYNIREEYRLIHRKKDVYKKYEHLISINTFADIWTGKTWRHIHMDVYTQENKDKQRNNYDKRKSHENISTICCEDVKRIRNMKNDLMPKKYVYENYFAHLNINTFNDVWYCRTFRDITADIPPKRGRRSRITDQNGCKNPAALFNEEQVREIRQRKKDGEDIKTVYLDYTFAKFYTFRNLWNGKTYNNLK